MVESNECDRCNGVWGVNLFNNNNNNNNQQLCSWVSSVKIHCKPRCGFRYLPNVFGNKDSGRLFNSNSNEFVNTAIWLPW